MRAEIEVSVEKQVTLLVQAAFDMARAPEIVRALRRHGPVPGVAAIEGERRSWATPGQKRRIQLEDGTSVTETLIDIDPPNSYRYNVAGFKGVAGALVEAAEGSWKFTAARGGCTISWSYAFRARNAAARLALLAFTQLFWRAYMHQGLANIVRYLDSEANVERGASK